MKKFLIYFLLLLVICLSIMLYTYWRKCAECDKNNCNQKRPADSGKVRDIPIKGKNVLFSITHKNTLLLYVKDSSASSHYKIIDSLSLLSGVGISVDQKKTSLHITDPYIPAGYCIMGIDESLFNPSDPGLIAIENRSQAMVNQSNAAAYLLNDATDPNNPLNPKLGCFGIPIPGGLGTPTLRVRGVATGMGVSSSVEPMCTYFDFSLSNTVYLQVDPSYPNLLLIGYPAPGRTNLIISQGPVIQ